MRRLAMSGALLALAFAAGLSTAVHAAPTLGPSITVSPQTGTPGTPVDVTGTGFPPGEIVALYIDLPGPFLDVPGPKADALGNIHKTIAWPDKTYDPSGRVKPAEPGTHTVCGDTSYPGSSQLIAAHACANFVVQPGPSPSASPSAAPASQLVGPSPTAVAVVFAILLVLAAVLVLLMRRTS